MDRCVVLYSAAEVCEIGGAGESYADFGSVGYGDIDVDKIVSSGVSLLLGGVT